MGGPEMAASARGGRDFFQNFLKTFLVCFHGAFTSSVIAPDIPPYLNALSWPYNAIYSALGFGSGRVTAWVVTRLWSVATREERVLSHWEVDRWSATRRGQRFRGVGPWHRS